MILERRPLASHGHGGQLYLRKEFANQFGFPLAPGADVAVQLVPHRAVVLLPLVEDLEYPLTVPHPQRIDPKTDLHDFPIEPLDQPDADASSLYDFEEGSADG